MLEATRRPLAVRSAGVLDIAVASYRIGEIALRRRASTDSVATQSRSQS